MSFNRIAKFRMDISWLQTNRATALRIFGNCIILKAEMLYYADAIEYTAESTFFPELPPGMEPPNVTWIPDIETGFRVEPEL